MARRLSDEAYYAGYDLIQSNCHLFVAACAAGLKPNDAAFAAGREGLCLNWTARERSCPKAQRRSSDRMVSRSTEQGEIPLQTDRGKGRPPSAGRQNLKGTTYEHQCGRGNQQTGQEGVPR